MKYVSGADNAKADTFNKKVKLQGNKKPLGAILKLNKDKKSQV